MILKEWFSKRLSFREPIHLYKMIRKKLIQKTIEAIDKHDGVILALPSTDTIKEVVADQIIKTLPREQIWRAQTPQLFFQR